MKLLNSFVVAVCLSAPAMAGQAASADVLGKWNVTFSTQQGPIASELNLKKDGDKIVGTISSEIGEGTVEAQVKAKELTVSFNFQSQNGPLAVEMTGTVDGQSAKGNYTAGPNQGTWEAKKVPDANAPKDATDAKEPKDAKGTAAKIDLTGAWTVSLQLDTISATPSLALKQDGEKLTGDYVSQQYGKFPLAGTIKGSDVTFSVTLNIEGNQITGTYTGTVQPDGTISGSVNIGDAMSGTFTAARKK